MAVTADTPGISATEIGQRTQMDKVAVSRAVAGLIEMGYLERRPSTDDARRSNLVLTHAGLGIYDLIVPLALAEEARLESVLSDKGKDRTRAPHGQARGCCVAGPRIVVRA